MIQDIERLEFMQKGIEAGDERCNEILKEIKQVLETRNAPMVNYFLVKMKLTLDRAYETYFANIDDIDRLWIEADVKRRFPHLG